MIAEYKAKSANGLKNHHCYSIKVTRPNNVYHMYIQKDLTTNEECDILSAFSSEVSLRSRWDFDRLEVEDE